MTPHKQKAIALLTLTQPVNAIAHQYNLSPQSVRRYREQLRKGRYAWIKAEGSLTTMRECREVEKA